jgi:trimethylamine--corrinoid protein Co-methyltransferase
MIELAGMSVLSPEKIRLISNASFSILEEIGVKVQDQDALEMLHGIGAYVENDGLVKIPCYLIEKALRSAPKRITLYDRNGTASMVLEGKNVYFGCSADCLRYLDPFTGKALPFTSEHSAIMARIGDYCSNISFINPVGVLTDYDPRMCSQVSFARVLSNTTKTINFISNEARATVDIIELATAIAGSKEELKRKPFIFHYCEPIPPLTHGDDSCQKLMLCAEAGIPVVYNPYCMMGGTAPVTLAGALAQSYAEILSGLVIHQAKKEGAPFIIGNMPATMDLRTTIGTYGAPEFYLALAGSSEIAHSFGLPFYGTAGTTDAQVLDYQAVAESTMNSFVNMLSWCHVVHDVGIMYHCSILSPELVVLTNEILDMLKVIRQGIRVDDEMLALDVIKQVGPGGHYLKHHHTLRHFREIWYSDIYDHSMNQDTPLPVNEKIIQKTKEIIEKHEAEPLSSEKVKIIKEFENKWIKVYTENNS